MVVFPGRTRRVGLAALLAVGALIATGCGSSSSKEPSGEGSSEKTSSTETSSGQENVAYASEQIEKWMAVPKFTYSGAKFDASKAKGKTIFSIPLTHANPFNVAVAEGMAEGAKQLGINYKPYWTQGQPSEWVQGMQQAISQKADLIDLQGGVDPSTLGPQITQAKSAKIPVVASHLYDLTQEPKLVDNSIPDGYQQAAKLEVDWAIKQTNGKADVVAITSNEVVPTAAIEEAISEEMEQHCPGCKLTYINVPVSEWGTKIQPDVQSALVKDPNINYVIPIYDSMSSFVAGAIKAAGRVGKVFISTFNGTPFVLKMMEEENIVTMDVGEDLAWEGWAYIDAEARILAGEEVEQTINEETPLRVFTKENVAEAGTPPKLSTGYGEEFESAYKSIWGLE